MPPKKNNKDVYEVHHESFEGKPALIVFRRQPGRCPLLPLCNILLLRHGGTTILDTSKRTDGTRYVSPKKLQNFVLASCNAAFDERVNNGSMSGQQRDQLLKEYQAQLEELRSKIDLYQQFHSISNFASQVKKSNDLFRTLHIIRRHALIPDPVKDARLYSAIKDESMLTLLVECKKYIAGCEKEKVYEQSYRDKMSLITDFVMNGPPFTAYGLDRLREKALEKELFLLYLNGALHVVYKRDGQLYLLATKEDMRVKHPDIMWFGLDESFNAKNPAETGRKFTNIFTPINERWTSFSDQLLQELEEEKRRDTAVSEVVALTRGGKSRGIIRQNNRGRFPPVPQLVGSVPRST